MKKRSVSLAAFVLLLPALSFAHQGEKHGREKADQQMAKMHKMMPRYEKSDAAINAALKKGDLATVEKETAYLLSTTADLKKAKPHKHVKELKDFQATAEAFEKDVKGAAEMARKGDVDGAKASFSKAEKGCASCHAKFRD